MIYQLVEFYINVLYKKQYIKKKHIQQETCLYYAYLAYYDLLLKKSYHYQYVLKKLRKEKLKFKKKKKKKINEKEKKNELRIGGGKKIKKKKKIKITTQSREK